MIRKLKYTIFCVVTVCLLFINDIVVKGQDDIDMSLYDFESIDEVLEDSEYEGQSFSDMVYELLSGDSEGIFAEIFSMAGDKLFGEIGYNKDIIIKVVLLAVASALLSKLSAMFVNGKMSDMGFFSVYTLLMVLLVSAFAVNTVSRKTNNDK